MTLHVLISDPEPSSIRLCVAHTLILGDGSDSDTAFWACLDALAPDFKWR